MLIRSKLSSLREYLTPINNTSNFEETGQISPDEFVNAGDFLTYKFPTWEWSSAPSKLQKDYLPSDKQFLVTRHVPSYQRAFSYLGIDSNLQEDEEELEDGWVKSHKLDQANPEEANDNKDNQDINTKDDENDIDDLIDDTAEMNMNEDYDDDFEDLSKNQNSLRKYDLYITYSTSYRVPKIYLVGFNSNGIPLLPDQMFEDISTDYRDKTATIENLPVSFNTTSVSIHPCKHSSVMKVLMKHAKQARLKQLLKEKQDHEDKDQDEENSDEVQEMGIRADQYLVIFLKFIASVTPGIEYDYTMEVL